MIVKFPSFCVGARFLCSLEWLAEMILKDKEALKKDRYYSNTLRSSDDKLNLLI